MPSQEVDGGVRPVLVHRGHVHALRVHPDPHQSGHIVARHRNEEGQHRISKRVEVALVGIEPYVLARPHTLARASKHTPILRHDFRQVLGGFSAGRCLAGEAEGARVQCPSRARSECAHEQLHADEGEDGHEAKHKDLNVDHCWDCADQGLDYDLHAWVANEQSQRAEHAHHA